MAKENIYKKQLIADMNETLLYLQDLDECELTLEEHELLNYLYEHGYHKIYITESYADGHLNELVDLFESTVWSLHNGFNGYYKGDN